MSSTLMWEPVSPNTARSLPNELKRVISRRLWDTDGTCGGGQVPMGTDDLPYLEGLRDAGVKGAVELIEAINMHGAVMLWHQRGANLRPRADGSEALTAAVRASGSA